MVQAIEDLILVVFAMFFLFTINTINIVRCDLRIHTAYKNKTTSNDNAAYFRVS